MATYIQDKQINSFPSTKRASVNKLMTENSVTRLINRLVDVDGFVITTGIEDSNNFLNDIPVGRWASGQADLEFVIRGYYFSVTHDENYNSGMEYLLRTVGWNPDENEHTLYAGIFIDKTDINFPELIGQTIKDGNYQAVYFYIDGDQPDFPDNYNESTCTRYELPLVKHKQQENGEWGDVVTLDSLFKFASRSIADIDGGEIVLTV